MKDLSLTRAHQLHWALAANFRTVKALLVSGFIQWDSARSSYVPSDLGLQALDDYDNHHQPDPEVLDWLIAATQVEEEPEDEEAPAEPEPVVVVAEPEPPAEPAQSKRSRTSPAVTA